MSNTSERLREIMSIRGIKQVDIIEATGITKGALSSYLSGRYAPKQNNIYLLAKYLNVNEAWLMGLDVPMERAKEIPASVSDLTSLEKQIIYSYRVAPEGIQDSVCKLLDIKRDPKDASTEVLDA